MFCMNCGAQLSDTAKFCGSCGTKVELSDLGTPAVPVNSAAPAQTTQTAQTAPIQEAQPVQLSKPAVSGQTAPTPAMSGTNSTIPAQAQTAQFAQPMEQVNAAQSAGDIQPMKYSAEIPAGASAVQPIKKKRRLVPGLCIAAGAVVVLGGAGAAFCHFNKPMVSKLIMGDAGYAHSVTMNALSGIAENGGAVSSAVQQSFSAGLIAAQSGSELSGGTTGGALDDGFGVSNEDAIGKALEIAAWQINHATGTRGVTSQIHLKAEFEQAVINALQEQNGVSDEMIGQIRSILDNIDLTMTLSEKDSGDALEYSADISTPNASIGTAQLRYEEDGTASLIFPGMSSTGFSAKLAPHSMEENAAASSFDFDKFYGNVSSGLKETFKGFEIKCGNGTTELGTLKFSGMTVQIDLDKSDLCSIAMAVIDAVRGDDGLIAYLRSLDETMTEQAITEAFDDLVNQVGEFRTGSASAAAQIKYYINGDNSLAGADITVYGSGENTAQFRLLTAGNDCEMNASKNGETLMQAHIRGESATSGSVTAVISDTNYDGQKEDVTFTVDYSDLGTANVFGFPMTTGSFKMNVSAEDTRRFLEDEMDFPAEIAAGAGSSSLALTIQPKGSGAEYRLDVDSENICHLTYSASVDEVSGDVAPKPGSEYTLIDIENASDDEAAALGQDIMNFYAALAEKDPLVKAIFDVQNGALGNSGWESEDGYGESVWSGDLGSGDDDNDWDDGYDWDDDEWGYNDGNLETPAPAEVTDADIISANTIAQRMKQSCDSFLTMMDSMKAAPESGSAEILLYVSEDEWQSYILTYDNDNFSGLQDSASWTDGKDHWGIEKIADDGSVVYDPDENNLKAYVSRVMPDVKEGLFVIYIQNGRVLGSVYANDPQVYNIPMYEHFESGSWSFDGSDRAGVADGYVVGTAPVLKLAPDDQEYSYFSY